MYDAEAMKFAESFAKDIKANAYEKDCLPNQGFPMSVEFAKQRLKIFDAVLNEGENDCKK
ncbi:MAG: hypothetical protein J6M62_02995 [Selenomonadaceae bacterium]|nr:hypothetical protein [Selenomonadaceae bacterium]